MSLIAGVSLTGPTCVESVAATATGGAGCWYRGGRVVVLMGDWLLQDYGVCVSLLPYKGLWGVWGSTLYDLGD